jgi:hypothetical protein
MALMSLSAYAQNSTNSPYTRYGYGRMSDHSVGAGRAMGGIGIGLRSPRQINPMNPASYSSMDSMTFLFDFGATAQMSWFSDGTNKQRDFNGNVDYMAMQFPLHKQIALSVGLLPFSSVGYSFFNSGETDGLLYSEAYIGTGGINQLYGGLSVDVWKKRLAVGANLNYLFGNLNNGITTGYGSSNPFSVINSRRLRVYDLDFDFGLQYTHPVSKTDNLVVGLIFSPKNGLKNENIQTISNGQTQTTADTTTDRIYELPAEYGIGFTYARDDKFIIAADVSYQEWSKITFNGATDNFNDRLKIAAGFEYLPNLYSRPLYNRMRYRAGVNYTNSYININGNGYRELGASLGVGIPTTPLNNRISYINFSFEYVKILPDVKTMIREDYARITLSYTFNELWFFKFKVN